MTYWLLALEIARRISRMNRGDTLNLLSPASFFKARANISTGPSRTAVEVRLLQVKLQISLNLMILLQFMPSMPNNCTESMAMLRIHKKTKIFGLPDLSTTRESEQ